MQPYILAGLTRRFLLMTATLHNGKDVDFLFFLALMMAIVSRRNFATVFIRSRSRTSCSAL